MSSHPEEKERARTVVVITGYNSAAIAEFANTLSDEVEFLLPFKVFEGKKLFDVTLSNKKCFVVMPRASRSLVYIHGDSSSMCEEINYMCGPVPDNWTMERGKRILETVYLSFLQFRKLYMHETVKSLRQNLDEPLL